MRLPAPRGQLSAAVIDHLTGVRPLDRHAVDAVAECVNGTADPCGDDDLHLALATCYELHYRGFDGVSDAYEWDLMLLAVRAELERGFEVGLRALVPAPPITELPIDQQLRAIIDSAGGPPLAKHLARHGTASQYRDFVTQRSAYHLKEADPHTWGIPRFDRRTKAALVEIQMDEYGGGNPERMHAALFAAVMRALDLDDTYGAYWDVVSGPTFASVNLISMFGLHRRFRAALLGHLAVLEMDSTVPNRRYATGLRRLGFGPDALRFYDEHVEADAVHEQIAAFDLCGSFLEQEPGERETLLWGAACGVDMDGRAGASLVRLWGSPPMVASAIA